MSWEGEISSVNQGCVHLYGRHFRVRELQLLLQDLPDKSSVGALEFARSSTLINYTVCGSKSACSHIALELRMIFTILNCYKTKPKTKEGGRVGGMGKKIQTPYMAHQA